jgi:hypothetical protein
MKNTSLKITLLACSLLLGSCASVSTSSAKSSSESTASQAASSSEETSAESSSSTEESSSLTSDIRSSYGNFTIAATSNGTTPTYDSATSTWTLGVSAKKATYTCSGYLSGRIVVGNPSNLTDYKGVVLILNGAYIESDSTTDYVIDDTNSSKYLALESAEGTTNYITNGYGAVHSTNNLRFGGSGNLVIVSKAGHGAKADDILLYGNGNITINAAADGLHGKDFYTNDSESTPSEFTGTLTINGVGEQALDFCDGSGTEADPWTGSITVDSGAKIVIATAQNVARANTAITVNGSIIATNILDTAPIITKNSGALIVTIAEGATFMVNGTALTSQTL